MPSASARGTSPVSASVDIAASVGPMHGVQPTAKTTPSSGAPSSPVRGCQDSFTWRWSIVTCPMNTSPISITITPPIESSSCW